MLPGREHGGHNYPHNLVFSLPLELAMRRKSELRVQEQLRGRPRKELAAPQGDFQVTQVPVLQEG